ncbi:nucleoside deaminase [Luteimonas vadosa]|uniref:Nucleoside deaminase n=1 Tax=Luteimonas vadosa TaxID=1165507 RepID=A0ABP9EAG1_9GAMM
MLRAQVRLALPEWIHEVVEQADVCATDADKVAFAIELSRRNIHAQTGGPFGAAVFGPDDHLVAVGVNRVLPQSTSVAHAEIMAYLLAQQGLGRARLNERADGSHFGPYVLATSSQPCCQCYGATIWAGIDRLLIGARSSDVESLTEFDEGPLPEDWIGELGKRGIEVVQDLHRQRACAVLSEYGAHGGKRY